MVGEGGKGGASQFRTHRSVRPRVGRGGKRGRSESVVGRLAWEGKARVGGEGASDSEPSSSPSRIGKNTKGGEGAGLPGRRPERALGTGGRPTGVAQTSPLESAALASACPPPPLACPGHPSAPSPAMDASSIEHRTSILEWDHSDVHSWLSALGYPQYEQQVKGLSPLPPHHPTTRKQPSRTQHLWRRPRSPRPGGPQGDWHCDYRPATSHSQGRL